MGDNDAIDRYLTGNITGIGIIGYVEIITTPTFRSADVFREWQWLSRNHLRAPAEGRKRVVVIIDRRIFSSSRHLIGN